MPQTKSVEIDFDIYKRIEAERRDFDDTPNAALRRLLGLPEDSGLEPATPSKHWASGWHGPTGVFLPEGTHLRLTYSGQSHTALIDQGKWTADGKTWHSPSGAASGLARTKRGKRTRLDGWNYWEALLPGETDWVPLREIRAKGGRV